MHLTLRDRKSTFEAINVARCYATSPKNPLVPNVLPGKVGKRDKSNILKGTFVQL